MQRRHISSQDFVTSTFNQSVDLSSEIEKSQFQEKTFLSCGRQLFLHITTGGRCEIKDVQDTAQFSLWPAGVTKTLSIINLMWGQTSPTALLYILYSPVSPPEVALYQQVHNAASESQAGTLLSYTSAWLYRETITEREAQWLTERRWGRNISMSFMSMPSSSSNLLLFILEGEKKWRESESMNCSIRYNAAAKDYK